MRARANKYISPILLRWTSISFISIKKKQLRGYDFDRQKPIDNFIVDFYCKDLQLAIEIDGESHYGNPEKDKRKDKRLKELGVTVLRFDDMDVVHQLDKVIEKIEKWIDDQTRP